MSGGDVQDTLNELERRLRELQAELSAPPRAPEPPAPPPPPPPPAASPLQDQLDELLRFRDQLADAAQKLVEDYSRLLEQINLASGRAAAPAQAPPTTAAGHVTFPVPPPTAPSPESALHAGEITIEAAPFEEIASVAAFEEAVRSVPHAEEVVVRSFDEGRAVVGLRLAAEIPLVFELRRASDQSFDVEHAEGGRLVLAMHSRDLPFPVRP
jgi:hypothetical protein